MRDYFCTRCGKTVQRKSRRLWIRSYCEQTGRITHLWRL